MTLSLLSLHPFLICSLLICSVLRLFSLIHLLIARSLLPLVHSATLSVSCLTQLWCQDTFTRYEMLWEKPVIFSFQDVFSLRLSPATCVTVCVWYIHCNTSEINKLWFYLRGDVLYGFQDKFATITVIHRLDKKQNKTTSPMIIRSCNSMLQPQTLKLVNAERLSFPASSVRRFFPDETFKCCGLFSRWL